MLKLAATFVGCSGDASRVAGPRGSVSSRPRTGTAPRDVDGDGDVDGDDDAIDTDGDGDRDDRISACTDALAIGSSPMRRLSNAEYARTLRDLFPGVAVPLPDLPDDTIAGGFENDARSLGPSDVRVARWEEIAFLYGEAIAATPSALAAFLPCAATVTDDASQHACGEQLLSTFGTRAFRRPLSAEDTARYLALFDAQRAEIDLAAAVELTVMALLEAPQFLYRIEPPREVEAPETIATIEPYELASRLSYFLWGTMPDDALFASAAAGTLPSEIEGQARRMLADPRARDQVIDFHRQWLDFDRILIDEHERRVPEDYPMWGPALRGAVREEQDRFVARTIFEGEGTLRALLLSPETEVNASLAALYGVSGPADDATWAPATLPGAERAGLLTRAGFLAAHAHAATGSPPLRGVFVTERLLCEPRPSPPPDADLSPPTAAPGAAPRTNRDLFEERTGSGACAGCHTRINGFGYGLEHYDAIGRFRALDRGLAVDASGNVLGTDVDGPYVGAIELSEALAESELVSDCATRQWIRFALGRAPERRDACLLERMEDAFAESGGDVRELMIAIASSPEFQVRTTGASE